MRTYIAIDLKSFYASFECVYRSLNPLKTNLVVADSSRTEKTICLAVTPSLKKLGVKGRPRLFEVNEIINKLNKERLKENNLNSFIDKSYDIDILNSNKDYAIDFIIAPPQMKKYIEVSTKIYEIYLKYFDSSDIHVYSVDEVFIDASSYLKSYEITKEELTRKIIKEILKETGITATAGIGTNLYLAKVAMDIMAKKQEEDKDGVRIAYLDETLYRKNLWDHLPITDFFRVGKGIAKRLQKYSIFTMKDIVNCFLSKDKYFNEDLLYKEFGVDAELLIDHAFGYENVTIKDIKEYMPKSKSISEGQVLSEAYNFHDTLIIVKEMAESLSLELVSKSLVTNQVSLTIGYDISNLENVEIMNKYKGEIGVDYLGREVPKQAHSSYNLDRYTSNTKLIIEAYEILYNKIVNKDLLIRRINISLNHVKPKDLKEEGYLKLNLFKNIEEEKEIEEKALNINKAIIDIKKKYGKNSVLKGMNLDKKGTRIKRNSEIGGHKA